MARDYTFDLTPPARPSLADLGGAAKRDDARNPPEALSMPTAQNWNFFARELEALGKFVPFLEVTIDMNSGTPTLTFVQSARSSIDLTFLQAIVGLLVDNGPGDTTFDYTSIASVFPPPTRPPRVDLIGATGARYPGVSQPTATSVRIITQTGGGVAADYSFTLTIW